MLFVSVMHGQTNIREVLVIIAVHSVILTQIWIIVTLSVIVMKTI